MCECHSLDFGILRTVVINGECGFRIETFRCVDLAGIPVSGVEGEFHRHSRFDRELVDTSACSTHVIIIGIYPAECDGLTYIRREVKALTDPVLVVLIRQERQTRPRTVDKNLEAYVGNTVGSFGCIDCLSKCVFHKINSHVIAPVESYK